MVPQRIVTIFILALLLGPGASGAAAQETSSASPDTASASFFTVADYDPARDPAQDLAATVRRAQAEGKRILLDVGGQWCSWCHALDRYLQENDAVNAVLQRHFLVMKVNYSPENPNEAFLAAYPSIPGYPHLYVLECDGTFLHSQGTAALEEGGSYSEAVFLAFLNEWAPEP